MAKGRRSLSEVRDLALDQGGDEERRADSATGRENSPRGRKDPEAKRNKWVQMNVFVPPELKQKLKIRALEDGRDMSDIVTELLTNYLVK